MRLHSAWRSPDPRSIDVAEVLPRGTFEVGLGVEPTLSTTRELVSRTLTTSGNFVLEYRLTVANAGPNSADVTLQDRLPNVSGYRTVGFASNNTSLILNSTQNIFDCPISVGAGQSRQVIYSFELR